MESKFLVMCRIYHTADCKEVLIQDKRHSEWGGLTFPGGKVEKGEAFGEAVEREIHEETGLKIETPILDGIIEWIHPITDARYVIFLYTAYKHTGTLLNESNEGKNFWLEEEKIRTKILSPNFEDFLEVYQSEKFTEAIGVWDKSLSPIDKFI